MRSHIDAVIITSRSEMRITDLSESFQQKPEIIQELRNVSQSEASKIVGGATNNIATNTAVPRNRHTSSYGCRGGGGEYKNFIKYRATF